MYEGPSFVNVSERELDEAIAHARLKYPFDELDREVLRQFANKTSEEFMHAGRRRYVEIRRRVIIARGIPYRSTRYNAYKVALAKIAGMRNSVRTRKKEVRSGKDPYERMVSDDNGPMTLEDLDAHLRQFGLDDDCLPVSY